jgi:hypothetical protein
VLKSNSIDIHPAGVKFPLGELGQFIPPFPLKHELRPDIWEMVVHAENMKEERDAPPDEALKLLEKRKDARARKDFAESDRLRDQISALGWTVQDSKEGQKLVKR